MDIAPELGVGEGRDPHHQQVTITTLPDYVLLEIFDFALKDKNLRPKDFSYKSPGPKPTLVGTKWQRLVHVCRRWRNVVFASPLRLNLELRCTEFTPTKRTLDVWPALPLIVASVKPQLKCGEWGVNNIVAALRLNDRICRIDLRGVQSSLLKRFAAVMKKPFPALTSLNLEPQLDEDSVSVLPDSFLKGYAPRLQELSLPDIPIPVFSKLPVSSPHLANLHLSKISYISPKTMAKCLSALPRLKTLTLEFHSPLHPTLTDRTSRGSSPLTRVVLSSLTLLRFKGVSEYLEELISWIDTPQLEDLSVTFFNQLIFDIPQLSQFSSRTEKLKGLNLASVDADEWSTSVRLTEKSGTANHGTLNLEILCANPDWQLSSVAQVCSSFSRCFSTLEDLKIQRGHYFWLPRWPDDMESTQWLDLLRIFMTVKNLYVSNKLAPHVSLALEDLHGERVTEVMPALQHLFLADFLCLPSKGCIKENVKRFIAARQLFDHPVTVHCWDGRYL